jgi:hypothetical protein
LRWPCGRALPSSPPSSSPRAAAPSIDARHRGPGQSVRGLCVHTT